MHELDARVIQSPTKSLSVLGWSGRPVQTKGPWPIYGQKEKLKRWERWARATPARELEEIRCHQDNFEIIVTFDSDEIKY